MIRLGFLGVGRVFEGRLRDVFKSELTDLNIEVSIICDQDLEKANKARAVLGGRVETKLESLFAEGDFDVVYIATESGKHIDHAKLALEAGKHVIVEKPPALLPGQASSLAKSFRKRGLMYSVILQNRFNPAMVILKSAYDQGRFGKLVLATVRLRWCRYQSYYEDGWHGTWAMDGGVINQQAYHHLDALQWVCGPVSEVVAAQTNALNILEAEDTTVAAIKFSRGGLGVIECTTAARPVDFEASVSIVGETGSAIVGGIALNKIDQWEFIDKYPEDIEIPEKYSEEVPTGYGLSHSRLLREIFQRLQDGQIEPPVSGEDAEPAINLVHELYRSVESGGWISRSNKGTSSRLGKTCTQLEKWSG